jgi:metal-responsive CopG/Arc/MetJ family transcriptional regulator
MIVGVSFPKPLLERLDKIRHDVPRSKYIQRLVEKSLHIHEEDKAQ